MSFEKIPMTRLTRVYQRKSKNNATYFVGRLGTSKILIFKDENLSESSDNPVWNILLQEVVDKPETDSERSSSRSDEKQLHKAVEAQAPLNDEIPF